MRRWFLRLLAILACILLPLTTQTSAYATAIDVGPGASNRATNFTYAFTYVDKANAANADGTIDTVQLWFASNATTVRVGIFYLVSANRYHCRSAAAIGSVTAGSMQAFPVSLPCVTGDIIGVYWASGTIERDSSGGSGGAFVSGNHCVAGDETSGYFSATGSISVYGIGSTVSVVAPTVTTQATSSIGTTTATGNGNITDTGGEDPNERGVCVSSINNPPTTADTLFRETGDSFSVGAYTESITGLSTVTTYYLRAYAINSAGTGYGSMDTFTTLSNIYQLPFPALLSTVDTLYGDVWTSFSSIMGITP